MNCVMKTGFFFGKCGLPAGQNCADCGKPYCSEHLRKVEGKMTCPGCEALAKAKAAMEARIRKERGE